MLRIVLELATLINELGENMKNLRKLGLSLTLMSVLSVTAFAGETDTPPCTPGETGTPPCTSQAVTNDSVDPNQLPSTQSSESLKLIDLAEDVVWSLLLF
jgi:hypothetical protein